MPPRRIATQQFSRDGVEDNIPQATLTELGFMSSDPGLFPSRRPVFDGVYYRIPTHCAEQKLCHARLNSTRIYVSGHLCIRQTAHDDDPHEGRRCNAQATC